MITGWAGSLRESLLESHTVTLGLETEVYEMIDYNPFDDVTENPVCDVGI